MISPEPYSVSFKTNERDFKNGVPLILMKKNKLKFLENKSQFLSILP